MNCQSTEQDCSTPLAATLQVQRLRVLSCVSGQAMRQAPTAQRGDPVARIAALVQSTLLLREALALLPSLGAALEPAASELLKAVRVPSFAAESLMFMTPVNLFGTNPHALQSLQGCFGGCLRC